MMTEQEKQLFLKDLCSRLPHKQKVSYKIYNNSEEITETLSGCLLDYIKTGKIAVVKPYLRPMSSMTDEEKAQAQMFMDIVTDENYGDGYSPSAWDAMNGFVRYCDSHHLDHRGLIVKGLALAAPEGMY